MASKFGTLSGLALGSLTLVALVTIVSSQCDGVTNSHCCNFPYTTQGLLPGAGGAKICAYNQSTNALVSNMAATLGSLVANGVIGGGCYCQMDCNPSQLVCLNAAGNWAVVELYKFVNWNYYCYCPNMDGGTTCQSAWRDPSAASPDLCCPNGPCPSSA